MDKNSSSDLVPTQKTRTCKHKSKKPLIFKMGGLLCPNCRKIVIEAYSPEWLKRIKNLTRTQKVVKIR